MSPTRAPGPRKRWLALWPGTGYRIPMLLPARRRHLLAVVLGFPPLLCLAQQPPANPVINGGFESSLQLPNLWDGVDKENKLSGTRASLPVLSESGDISSTYMPVSVAAADLNNDGKADLLTADPVGYVRVYFNSGTPQDPQFTVGNMSAPFLAVSEGDPPYSPSGLRGGEHQSWRNNWIQRRQGPRVAIGDLSGGGKLSLVVGNYYGDILFFPNTGTGLPVFTQPQPFPKALIPTMVDPVHRWGNVFSPLVADWDGDGRVDLLIGEGSYSANNVHLLLNQGSGSAPVFNENKRQALALGEGRMQLSPAIADFNGDGLNDILVADRNGRVAVHQRPANWKFGDVVPFSGYINSSGGLTQQAGSALSIGSGITALAAADMNGDGLFDLLAGRNSGRIAWAPNKGTKDSPKFDALVEFAGQDTVPQTFNSPSQWDVDTGASRGNFYSFASCVTAADDPAAEPKEGTRALKFGYVQVPGATMPRPLVVFPGGKDFDRRRGGDAIFRASAEERGSGGPSNLFVLRQNPRLEIGKTYTLSFQVKGARVANGMLIFGWRGHKTISQEFIQGERGAATKKEQRLDDQESDITTLSPGASWSTFSRDYKIEFNKTKELNQEKNTSEAVIEISFELGAPDGVLYLDDLKLVPKS